MQYSSPWHHLQRKYLIIIIIKFAKLIKWRQIEYPLKGEKGSYAFRNVRSEKR